MYRILTKDMLTPTICRMKVEAPRLAKAAQPGQFLIIRADERGERVPLTISDFDREEGSVTIVTQQIGASTSEICSYEAGDAFADVVGPLGIPSDFTEMSADELAGKRYVFIAGGVGTAPVYPQVKWLHNHGVEVDCIIGARTRSLLVFEEELRSVCNLYVTTDDGSSEYKGVVTEVLKTLVENGKHYDEVVAIGPMIMMKFVAQTAQSYGIKCTVSLNSLMVDGTGMCGACRVSIGGETKFTCVDGPEFDASLVDFDLAMKRQAMYNTVEGKKQMEAEEEAEGHICHVGGIADEVRDKKHRIPVREQDPKVRAKNFNEVCLGYNAEEAILEAQRCLNCKNPQCVKGCPVNVHIPEFIKYVAEGNFMEAAKVINRDSALPAVCGRVCPQEKQCEGNCVMGKKSDPIAIGKLERFVGDWVRENKIVFDKLEQNNGHKVAVIGSGPSGITCAKDLMMMGYDVTVFEALHEYGGVLVYGIPAFRLPKETVVRYEIENVQKMGVHFEKDIIVGRTVSIDDLMDKEGFEAVYIASGAGLPNFMNIPGENLCGVVSANEFLTRNNLLFAYKEGYETPNYVGKKVAVVGGGNVAMDAARTALRLGADVKIVYRRSKEELPARAEEVHHAKEEGVEFHLLCNPIEILGDDNGWVNGMKCNRMQLGEADASGRRKPVVIPNSEFILDVDMIIMSIGTSPNPLISSTTPGLEINKKNCIVADEESGQTSRQGVFAGGDAVSGAATVILAMGAGKKAAKAIDEYIRNK